MRKLFFIAACAAVALAGCKSGGKADAANASAPVVADIPSGRIVYFNIDSLVSNYDMYNDLRTEYEAKAKKIENELTSKGRRLENDIVDFQNKVNKGLVTSATAQSMQADLEKRQNSFMQQRDKAMGELREEESVMLNQIHYSIKDFLEEFNSDLRYGMIISTSEAGPVMNADPALDITTLILDGLNKQYVAGKGSQAKTETATEE